MFFKCAVVAPDQRQQVALVGLPLGIDAEDPCGQCEDD
jgi:hypothetical protein